MARRKAQINNLFICTVICLSIIAAVEYFKYGTRDFEPNNEHLSFCIKENLEVPPVHYPIHENKGLPGYIAYAGYDKDYSLVKEMCADTPIYHF